MALPQSISGDLYPAGPPMKAPNGAIYLLVYDGSGTPVVEAWKLAAPDTGSWAEIGSAGPVSSGAAWAMGCQYEHMLYVAYPVLSGSEHNVVEKQFNTATDDWIAGTYTVYSGGPGEPPASYFPCALVATPNYLYCLHPCDDEKVHGTAYARCMVSYRALTAAGGYSNSSVIGSGVQQIHIGRSIAVNGSEYPVVIYNASVTTGSDAAVWNRSSFGTAVSATITLGDSTQTVSYMDGSTCRIIHRNEGTNITRVWRLTSSGTTVTSVALTTVGTTSILQRSGIARWGTTLYAWLTNTSNNPAYSDSTDHGATWSGPTEFSNPSNNLTDHPWANAYARKGQLKIGIVYREGTTQLSYNERTISNPSAPGFASAKTPTRQNRILVSA